MLLSEVDMVKLLTASKGIVLGVVIILLTLVVLSVFVILYKMIQISQAQSQSVTFLDRFWESKRLDDIYRVAEGLKYSPLAAMFRAGYVELDLEELGIRDGEAYQVHDLLFAKLTLDD